MRKNLILGGFAVITLLLASLSLYARRGDISSDAGNVVVKSTLQHNADKSRQAGLAFNEAGRNVSPRFAQARKQNDLKTPVSVLGCIVSSHDAGLELGIYSIPLDGSEYTLHKKLNTICNNGVLVGDEYVTTTYDGMWSVYHEKYNIESWENTWYEDGGGEECLSTDMAYDATTGNIYGCFPDYVGGWCFAIFSLEDWYRFEITSIDEPWYGVAVNNEGVLYAITPGGTLYTVDKESGNTTSVGETGIKADKATSAVCDPTTGDIYYVPVVDGVTYLYKIDPATAKASYVRSYNKGEHITGLCPLPVEETVAVPSRAIELKADFEGESLSGTFSFKAPATNVDGVEGSGELTYTVSLNGEPLENGTTTYNGNVSMPVMVDAPGNYTFAVTVANEAGSSEEEKLALWIGEQDDPGVIKPPYTNTFDDEGALEGYENINLNNDGSVWTVSNGWVQMFCNEVLDMNSWLITPGIKLDKDKFYEVSFDAAIAHRLYPERVEAFAGSSAAPEGMTILIIDKTDVTTTAGTHLRGYLKVDVSGIYYIGVHGCSDKDSYYLRVDNLSIDAGSPTTCPDKVSGLTVSPDPLGNLTANISFTTPSLDIAGNPLSAITKVDVMRGTEIIKTFDNPGHNVELTHKDVVAQNGMYYYTVVCYNESGRGKDATTGAYIGVNIPAAPQNAKVEETSLPGEVRVSWTAPATDQNGNPINPDLISYSIVDAFTKATVVEGVKGTEYTFSAISSDSQDFVQYGVFASTTAGLSNLAAMTGIYPVGKAYNLPVEESFANGDVQNDFVWGNEPDDGSSAWLEMLTNNNGVNSQDGDNGYVGCFSKAANESARLLSGKINVGDAKNPVLSFYYYKIKECENTISVSIDAGEGLVDAGTFVCGPEMDGWTRAVIPLADYRNKDIRISFRFTNISHSFTILDNIVIFDQPECDMAAVSIGVPAKVEACNPAILLVNVVNNGSKDVNKYLVNLYCNGEIIQNYPGKVLASGKTEILAFYEEPGLDSEAERVYYAEVICDGDEVADNNCTRKSTMFVVLPSYPVPFDLSASGHGSSTELTWSRPDLTNLPSEPKTDDVEQYESFALNNAGDWSFVDVDGGDTYGFTGITFPNVWSPMAWLVFDNTDFVADPAYASHSGSKYFVSMCSMTPPNDDWLISPELDGLAQTVSFYARAVDYYTESFEFLYSTTGTDTHDFIKIGEVESVPDIEWTEYSYMLPAGAKYFAIRCTSDDALALFIDDLTFAAAGAPKIELELKGYNVYRDGVKLTETPVTGEAYTDNAVITTDHKYYVTAVYDKGESAASNIATRSSGLNSETVESIGIKAGDGRIVVTGADGCQIEICSPDGRCIFSGIGSEYTCINVAAGIYIVKAGNKVVKVMVK